MSAELLRRARAGDREAFAALIETHHRELHAHCYRMLGSLQDAQDALQETLLSAWLGLEGFEGRSSVRTWLYRVATNRCLNMLRSSHRRPMTVEPLPMAPPEPTRLGEVLWLQPYPDAMLDGLSEQAPGPEARYESGEAISLAFVTAMQLLPPNQRAALLLRDVLGYRAREAAKLLGITESAVTNALKRARATMEGARTPGPPPPAQGRPTLRADERRHHRLHRRNVTMPMTGRIAMGKIVVSENVSLDGVVEDPTGEEGFTHGGWFEEFIGQDREAWAKVEFAEALGAEALLLGRRSDEYLGSRWVSRSGDWADRLNKLPKYVVSSTRADPVWTNSTVLTGEVVAEVSKLKQDLDGDIVVYASRRLVRTLMEHDLVDELRLIVFPVVLGSGERLFGDTSDKTSLRLVKAESIGDNLSYLTYEVVRGG